MASTRLNLPKIFGKSNHNNNSSDMSGKSSSSESFELARRDATGLFHHSDFISDRFHHSAFEFDKSANRSELYESCSSECYSTPTSTDDKQLISVEVQTDLTQYEEQERKKQLNTHLSFSDNEKRSDTESPPTRDERSPSNSPVPFALPR